ncbi:alpha/beta fold hydrolase [Steroidobacter cummioxidans]|uniref:alpha/beta fold hydrolase n=1 Tax=Steroidobacter cummioxidans TaxID=1803913 RepID=UPI00137A4638|nr:alpha/beta fold hydrolase [Steroidobacter cummioxidans]
MTTLVLIPGLLCDEFVWSEQRRALSSHARTWVPDHGSIDSLTDMAQAILRDAPAERFALAGHSMGGRVALEVMRLAPQRVERLALLDSGWQPRQPGVRGEEEQTSRLALLEDARRNGMHSMGRRWALGMLHPKRLDSPLFEAVVDMVERKTPEIFAAQIRALLARPNAMEQLLAIQCPTLVACGRQDSWSPLSQHLQMAVIVRGARLRIIEESGHMSTLEQPEAVTAALAEWLSGKEDIAQGQRPIALLERQLAESACRDVVCRAALKLDANDLDGFAAFFTSDAVVVRPGKEPLKGIDALLESYRSRPTSHVTRHLVAGSVVDLRAPDEAHAISNVLVWTGHADRQVVGEFEDTLRLCSDGLWRIAHRQARFLLHVESGG